jgi:hypothetical protein
MVAHLSELWTIWSHGSNRLVHRVKPAALWGWIRTGTVPAITIKESSLLIDRRDGLEQAMV